MAFATSAVRDATNSDEVLAAVLAKPAWRSVSCPARDEARPDVVGRAPLVRLERRADLALDIGGGSLEMSNGVDEPDVALSVPLGAGRLTRGLVAGRPARPSSYQRAARLARRRVETGGSRTHRGGYTRPRSRLLEDVPQPGAADRGSAVQCRQRVQRRLTASGLRQLIAFISRMTRADRADLEGSVPTVRGSSWRARWSPRPRCAHSISIHSTSVRGHCGKVSSCDASTRTLSTTNSPAWRRPVQGTISEVQSAWPG